MATASRSADGNVYNGIEYPRAYWEGVIARWQGEKEKASLAFTDARRQVEDVVHADMYRSTSPHFLVVGMQYAKDGFYSVLLALNHQSGKIEKQLKFGSPGAIVFADNSGNSFYGSFFNQTISLHPTYRAAPLKFTIHVDELVREEMHMQAMFLMKLKDPQPLQIRPLP